jgi:hypothetical protein
MEAHMRKRVAFVAVLALLGMVAGVAVTGLAGERYRRSVEIELPVGADASHVVAITSGRHPGVRVYAMKNIVRADATGSLDSTAASTGEAVREVIAASHGTVKGVEPGFPLSLGRPLGNRVQYGLVGLLAGLSAALGFLAPRRSRGALGRSGIGNHR